MSFIRVRRFKNLTHVGLAAALLAIPLSLPMALAPSQAVAQALAATVNDSPITTYDLDQRMRLLRVLRQNASREAALESVIEDRLKLKETSKFGIKPSEQDASNELARIAAEKKIAPQALLAGLQSSGVNSQHWQEFGKARAAWRGLVQAMNKNVGVSESRVREALSNRGGKIDTNEYRLRQIVLIVPRRAGAGAVEARMRDAEGLRSRFTDCQSGVKLAQSLRDVAVKPVMTRSAASLSDELAALLDRTPVGRLTPPQRSANGLEMLAICGKSADRGDGAAAQEVREELMSKRLEAAAEKLYKPLRKRAIVVRR